MLPSCASITEPSIDRLGTTFEIVDVTSEADAEMHASSANTTASTIVRAIMEQKLAESGLASGSGETLKKLRREKPQAPTGNGR